VLAEKDGGRKLPVIPTARELTGVPAAGDAAPRLMLGVVPFSPAKRRRATPAFESHAAWKAKAGMSMTIELAIRLPP
jgi:hypothetical protein